MLAHRTGRGAHQVLLVRLALEDRSRSFPLKSRTHTQIVLPTNYRYLFAFAVGRRVFSKIANFSTHTNFQVMLVRSIVLSDTVVSGLRVAGPMFFLGMQGSSVLTARGILADKSVGALSPLPFLSLLTNCIIWTYYGLLRKDNTVFVPNVIGVLSGLSCVAAYQKWAPVVPLKLYSAAAFVVLIATALASVGNFHLIGLIGCALAVIVMGAPLATLKTVVQSKSTASMPFTTSLMGFLNSMSWSAYGLLVADDVMIYGPNLAGLILSGIQMVLFMVFGLPPAKPAAKAVF